ncbi:MULTISPECIES: phosphotransferase enzyme family protein [Thermoactinomyces]|jgi:amicoumacin kinase|uniref:Phosphotransferase n=1 Tax=Thermoactinomyces daqus TaxID=1329516 RepID=A0A7W1XD24_9BACL|nr:MULTISPECIES: phosphotransferase [Thermoactinomyces]MBA4544444.1 phosphotransferase [Thermoactinomyces daqus]MBH8599550.1 phosphotransferase [Thermoactinomyces sp. CICC 10523]MBH8605469.1 phosphotransferase [Thermoactinomyces sp. CICC 10522]MBH8609173.1 phosphotransferase [Thermoactinomyces sp. CICC 10521]
MWKKEIVEEACRRFKGTESTLKYAGGDDQGIYEYERDGESCFLQLVPIAAKDKAQLHSELQWISFLRRGGVPVPKQILSARGQTVETIVRLPFPCCIYSFEKPAGRKVSPADSAEWNPALFRRWGETMGKIHSLSRRFLERFEVPSFDDWNEGEIYHRDFSFIEGRLVDRFISSMQRIASFSRTNRSYGIIHNDFHHGNFLIGSAKEIIPVHFHRMKFHFYTYDIAIAVYHVLSAVPESWQDEWKARFLGPFMEGYFLENELDEGWEEQVEFFVGYRRLFYYLYLMTTLNGDPLDERVKKKFAYLEEQLSRQKVRF